MSQQVQRLTFDKIETFMFYIDRDDVLDVILSKPEKQRPAIAAQLFNKAFPNDTITTQQARYIGDHYYWEDGRICKLTPELKARL